MSSTPSNTNHFLLLDLLLLLLLLQVPRKMKTNTQAILELLDFESLTMRHVARYRYLGRIQ